MYRHTVQTACGFNNTNSRLTFSTAVVELRPAELDATQRYWPWLPGRELAIVSTEPSGPILALSGGYKQNSSFVFVDT